MDIKDIKFFKKEKNFKKESSWLDINIYWRGAIGFVLFSTTLAVIFGYLFFKDNNQDIPNSGNVTGGHVETVSKERINAILNIFSDKQQVSDKIISSPAPVTDPSL